MLSQDRLEELANELFLDGLDLKSRDVDLARVNLAVSWGLNRILGRGEFLYLCHRHLESSGLTQYGSEVYEKRGLKRALKILAYISLFRYLR